MIIHSSQTRGEGGKKMSKYPLNFAEVIDATDVADKLYHAYGGKKPIFYRLNYDQDLCSVWGGKYSGSPTTDTSINLWDIVATGDNVESNVDRRILRSDRFVVNVEQADNARTQRAVATLKKALSGK